MMVKHRHGKLNQVTDKRQVCALCPHVEDLDFHELDTAKQRQILVI